MKPLYLEDVREENQKLLNKYNMEEIALTTCNNTFDNIRLKMNRKKHLEAFLPVSYTHLTLPTKA